MFSFSAAIYKLGINPVVDPPDDVMRPLFEQAGRDKGPIPVCGTLRGAEYVQTLVKFRGAWRLYINAGMLKASGLTVGDIANITIAHDRRPRKVPVPTILADMLAGDPLARAEWQKLSPSRQKEILRYIGALKSEPALIKNIDRVRAHLISAMNQTPQGPGPAQDV
ncbi:MAG TPA: YdeI/OmpD-associated family protein [Pyrinomonadaceae bacterium]|nr:YdeI/OmpD-associated family protein [Pyrinomonadaceae bacterium]